MSLERRGATLRFVESGWTAESTARFEGPLELDVSESRFGGDVRDGGRSTTRGHVIGGCCVIVTPLLTP